MRNKEKKETTFTKLWLGRFFTMAIADIQITFLLAICVVILDFINGYEVNIIDAVVPLAVAMVSEIIALAIGYFCKSFRETKEEKDHELEVARFESECER